MKTLHEIYDFLVKHADGTLEDDPEIDEMVTSLRPYATNQGPELLTYDPLISAHGLFKRLIITCSHEACEKNATLWQGDIEDRIPPISTLIRHVAKKIGWEVYYDKQQMEPVFHCPSHFVFHGPPAQPLPKLTTMDIEIRPYTSTHEWEVPRDFQIEMTGTWTTEGPIVKNTWEHLHMPVDEGPKFQSEPSFTSPNSLPNYYNSEHPDWYVELDGVWMSPLDRDKALKKLRDLQISRLNSIAEFYTDDNEWVRVRIYSINAGNSLYQVIPLDEGTFGHRWVMTHPYKSHLPHPTINVYEESRIRWTDSPSY